MLQLQWVRRLYSVCQSVIVWSVHPTQQATEPSPGTQLRAARPARNLSARDLGALVGVAASTIARIERGETQPRYSMVAQIAVATGHSLSLEAGDAA